MDDRIDALRHYDRRAAQLKKGVRMERQELQSNDFEIVASDPTSSSAVRRLFTSTPDDPETLSDVLEKENITCIEYNKNIICLKRVKLTSSRGFVIGSAAWS